MTKTIQERVRGLLDNPRTGLRASSDTNKTRMEIFGIIEEAHTQAVEETVTKLKEKGEEAVTGLWYITEDNFSSLTNKQNV